MLSPYIYFSFALPPLLLLSMTVSTVSPYEGGSDSGSESSRRKNIVKILCYQLMRRYLFLSSDVVNTYVKCI